MGTEVGVGKEARQEAGIAARAGWRRIGLIGGIGWPSTRDYYAYLNRALGARDGGLSGADLVIRSLDLARVVAVADVPGAVEALLLQAASDLHAAGAEVLGVCSHTGQLFCGPLRADRRMNFVALDQAVARGLRAGGVTRVWLLGVERTLLHPMLHEALAGEGIATCLPTPATMRALDEAIFTELERGRVGPLMEQALDRALAELARAGATEVLLACTELAPALAGRRPPFRLWDSVPIHCEALLAAAAPAMGRRIEGSEGREGCEGSEGSADTLPRSLDPCP